MPDFTIEALTTKPASEEWTADIGNYVSLTKDDIHPGSERVIDSNDDELTRGEDYEVNYDDGTIKAISNGDLAPGENCSIDYEYFSVGYSFEVENVQPVIREIYTEVDNSGKQDVRFTVVPVWKPPEEFVRDVNGRGYPYVGFRVRDSSGNIVVDGDIHWTVVTSGIGGETLEHDLIELVYEEVVESFPEEEIPESGGGPPSYSTPWGRYVDMDKLTDRDVEGTSYCW